MQSAFVSIGLERDAFLYVSDFFDEEEEIERIVMEKSKKITPEEAKREANDQIDRARSEREKQMEAVQEIAEPLSESSDHHEAAEADGLPVEPRLSQEPERKGQGRNRAGRKGREPRPEELPAAEATDSFQIEDSGFERIIDDSDTGEMFKDAFMQERIVDQVRAVEFDMESTPEAEVGSLIGSVAGLPSGFERIADDDEEPVPAKPKKGRAAGKKSSKAAKNETGEGEVAGDKTVKSKAAKDKSARGKSKKAAETETLEDAEASVTEPGEQAEMSVRRGGRGRRRGGGGRGRKPEDSGSTTEASESADTEDDNEGSSPVEAANGETDSGPAASDGDAREERDEPAVEASEAAPEVAPARETREPRDNRGRDNSRREGGRDRDCARRVVEETTATRVTARGDRSKSGPGDGKRFDRNDRNDRRDRPQQPTISDLLREGQEILVQIAKEPIARKGARITSHIALPGRFLVYMPTIEHLGVSRKIESASERSRLRAFIQRIRQEEDIPSGGFIVRTAGVGISEEDLRQDARYFVRTWQDVKKSTEKAKSPALVHQDLDIVQRLLRDQMSTNLRQFASIAKKNICGPLNSSTEFSREWSTASSFTPAMSRSSMLTACRKRSIRP